MKSVLKCLFVLFMGIVLGTGVMFLIYCLPTDSMKQHISESMVVMETETNYPALMPGYEVSQLDNYTDSIMLLSSAYTADASVFDRAMSVYRPVYEEMSPAAELVAYGKGDVSYTEESYARYWHGYQVFLKPLLLVFNLQQIRYINMCVQLVLVCSIVCLMTQKNLKRYIFPYLITNCSLTPVSIALSLQYSSIFYIVNIALLILLIWDKEIINTRNKMVIYFLGIGMATAFFDLLTYPAVTLGIPLVMFFVLDKRKSELCHLQQFIKNCFVWALGYGGMWAGKWIISSLILKRNMITDAINTIFSRTSSEVPWGEFTRQDVLMKNFQTMFKTPIRYVVVFYVGISLIYLIYRMLRDRKNYIYNLQYLLIACIPIVWYLVLANHSYIHFWFTYREVAICIFAIFVWLTKNMDYCMEQREMFKNRQEKRGEK